MKKRLQRYICLAAAAIFTFFIFEKIAAQRVFSVKAGPSLAATSENFGWTYGEPKNLKIGFDCRVSLDLLNSKRVFPVFGLGYSLRYFTLNEYYGGLGAGCHTRGDFALNYLQLAPFGLRAKILKNLSFTTEFSFNVWFSSSASNASEDCFSVGIFEPPKIINSARGVIPNWELAPGAAFRWDIRDWFLEASYSRGLTKMITQSKRTRNGLHSVIGRVMVGFVF